MPSKILSDMRKVYRNPPSKDVTESQNKLRQWYDDDPKGFLKYLGDLERAYAFSRGKEKEADAKKAEVSEEEKRDIGTERCEELIAYLLKQYGVEPEEQQ